MKCWQESCFVFLFHEWNKWKNPQFNFPSQDLSKEHNFFKWDGKETKILHLFFHRIWKNIWIPKLLQILKHFVCTKKKKWNVKQLVHDFCKNSPNHMMDRKYFCACISAVIIFGDILFIQKGKRFCFQSTGNMVVTKIDCSSTTNEHSKIWCKNKSRHRF